MAGVESLEFAKDIQRPKDAAPGFAAGLELFVPLAGLIDLQVEKARIGKETERLETLVKGLEIKLNNMDFLKKAPVSVIEKERQKQADFAEKLKKLRQNLEVLG